MSDHDDNDNPSGTSSGGHVVVVTDSSCDLPASVAPFILRGVTLAGIDSVMAPRPVRLEAWERLARDLDPALLASATTTRPLADAPALAPELLAGAVRGRVVLEVP